METVEDILNFCNAAVFYDYTDKRFTCELNQVRNCTVNSFFKTVPESRIRVSLCVTDDINLKINNNYFEDFTENIHDLRENMFYKLSFEKCIRDEQQTDRPILNEDDDQQKS